MTKKIVPIAPASQCCDSQCGCHKGSSEKPTSPKKDIKTVSDCGCEESSDRGSNDTSATLLKIDFLYLDLSVCSRCQSTESTLEKTLDDIGALLSAAGYEVVLDKIHIDSIDMAICHKFLSSPTIRINGADIISKTEESNCKDCGDLCGGEVDCRDWIYEGVRYTEPPKQMLVNAILKEIYLPSMQKAEKDPYEVPDNIKRFFHMQ